MAKIAIDQIYKLFDKFINEFIIEKSFCLLCEEEKQKYEKKQVLDSFFRVKDTFIDHPISNEGKTDEEKKKNFKLKLEEQFKDREIDKICFSHINWLWAFAASEMTGKTKNTFPFDSLNTFSISKDFALDDNIGIGSANPRLQKYAEIVFLMEAIKSVWDEDDMEKAKHNLLVYCIKDKENGLPMKNALLHLCKPDEYENIFSNSVKESIVNSLGWLDETNKYDRELHLKSIRECLITDYKLPDNFSFYDDGIRELWQIDDTKVDNLTDAQLLEYKKAMVLFGPPGTGKTFTALKLARIIVLRSILKQIKDGKKDQYKDDFSVLLNVPQNDEEKNNQQSVLNKYVDRLQMHINYNYEDFVIGMIVRDNNVQVNHGYIYTAIDNARKQPDLPYIVILDEINRTDISRVFGEVFSAMEYRGEDINMSIPGARKLNIPDNMFFIGTMNEIDFSLERVDFALRRRFIWKRKGFSVGALNEMLNDKEYDVYCKDCANLNTIICKEHDLGPNYEIGHSFFGEIKRINESLENIQKSKKVLWQISIEPMLQAYCGVMADEKKNEIIKKCKEAFGLAKQKSDGGEN